MHPLVSAHASTATTMTVNFIALITCRKLVSADSSLFGVASHANDMPVFEPNGAVHGATTVAKRKRTIGGFVFPPIALARVEVRWAEIAHDFGGGLSFQGCFAVPRRVDEQARRTNQEQIADDQNADDRRYSEQRPPHVK